MEHILNENEKKELWNEYYAINDKVRELQKRQDEIDHTIRQNSCNVVASRYIPLNYGDKIRIVKETSWMGRKETTIMVGFFGSFHMDTRPYTVDDGVSMVKLRLYQVKKDGTQSQKSDDIWASNITYIEKVEE